MGPTDTSMVHQPVTGAIYAVAVTVGMARVPPHVGVMWLPIIMRICLNIYNFFVMKIDYNLSLQRERLYGLMELVHLHFAD